MTVRRFAVSREVMRVCVHETRRGPSKMVFIDRFEAL
jgi:hypothetical protein